MNGDAEKSIADDLRLTQRTGIKGLQEFRLTDEQLQVRVTRLGNLVEFAVPLVDIESTGLRICRRAWITTFILAPVLASATAYCVYYGMFGFKSYQANWWTGSVVTGILLFVALAHCVQGWANHIVFRSSKGNLSFHFDRPSVSECRGFVSELERRIEEARRRASVMATQSVR